jgi:hypothetical protein
MMIDKKMTAGRPITIISRKHAILILPPAIAIFIFTGCWTPPNANVQLRGEARLIQNGVSADDNNVRATVQSVDANQRIFELKLADGTLVTCTVGTQGADFGKLQQGDHVKVTLAEKLAVYVLNNGKLPAAGGIDETIPFIARVQLVDPSYRLLTLQYLNGHTEVLKAGLDAKLLEMHPGDAVVLESAVARSIRIEKP